MNWPNAQLARESNDSGAQLYWYGLERIGLEQAGAQSFHRYDGLANVVEVDSSAGQPQWHYSFEPFGAARSAIESDPNAPANPMRFAGEYEDPTGLYDLRARLYEPAEGRFNATDPLAHSLTEAATAEYAYANNRPTVLRDPSGMGAVWNDSAGQHGCLLLSCSSWNRVRNVAGHLAATAADAAGIAATVYAAGEGCAASLELGPAAPAGCAAALAADKYVSDQVSRIPVVRRAQCHSYLREDPCG